jgi:hypothetical protein
MPRSGWRAWSARHPFDPVSLVLGTLFCAAGTIVLLGGTLPEESAWLVPVGLLGLGAALLRARS